LNGRAIKEETIEWHEEWRSFVHGKYGSEPILTYLDTPVVVDNMLNEIISDP